MEARRNSRSPLSSYNHVKKQLGEDLQTSPLGSVRNGNSPRAFWVGKNALQEHAKVKENITSPRKSSLEELKKASRVQNNKLLRQHKTSPQADFKPVTPGRTVPEMRANSPGTPKTQISVSQTKKSSSPLPSTPPRSDKTLTSIMRHGDGTQNHQGKKRSSLLSSYKVNGRSDADSGTDEDSVNLSPGRRKAVAFNESPRVVNYELMTPEPSIDGSQVDYDSQESDEESDNDYDLHNFEKTPVIDPVHWTAEPGILPGAAQEAFRLSLSPSSRPLPPIPGAPLERRDSNSRPLPTLPTKAEFLAQQKLTLDEKMQLMMGVREGEDYHELEEGELDTDLTGTLSDDHGEHEADREDSLDSISLDKGEVSGDLNQGSSSLSDHEGYEYRRMKKISRESIRRRVNERQDSPVDSDETETQENYAEYQESGYADKVNDIKVESDEENHIDMSKIQEYQFFRPGSPDAEHETTASEYSDAHNGETDEESRYTEADDDTISAQTLTPTIGTPRLSAVEVHADSPPTPTLPDSTVNIPALEPPESSDEAGTEKQPEKEAVVSLPEISSDFGLDGLGLKEYLAPPIESIPMASVFEIATSPTAAPSSTATSDLPSDRPTTPEDRTINIDSIAEDLERTPESVIRHKIERNDYDTESEYDEDGDDFVDDFEQEQEIDYTEEVAAELAEEPEEHNTDEAARTPTPVAAPRSPSPIPEESATVRAPNGKLKTRPSATPADLAAMAAARRQVSADHSNTPPVPNVPDKFSDKDQACEDEVSDDGSDIALDENGDLPEREPSIASSASSARARSYTMPELGELNIDLKLDDLSEEFERVIETQKRGYLMRQSTRVIHATSRDEEEPRPGHQRTQSWQVEPWRTSNRRRSNRQSLGRKGSSESNLGSTSSLPGQANALTKALPPVTENSSVPEGKAADPPDNGERGRLFVKVIGVRDLNLPMPQRETTWFCLTLDNGLHCVTTSWLELGRNAPIGQEFELVVLKDLEFQLTLQAKLEKPPPKPVPAPIPVVKAPVKTKSTFSRVFITPKKRKELEKQKELQLQQQKQQQQQQEAASTEPQSAWELLNGLVGSDGSFARSYVCLKDFESRAYGRPFTTEINCFNEWAIENPSVKTKRGLNPAKKAPYKIGKLEVQFLFVPKPAGTTEKDMPKSMAAAMRELREAESMGTLSWEGYLSQQGGDCPYWRRRYFKLVGTKLTAFHEVSRQPRATINLAKAVKVIDDRPSLTEQEVGSGKSRRKSAFAEMEDGYMFVEEGFRIKFANGETIDFYADSAEDKKDWMKVLSETIGTEQDIKPWCELILNKERKDRERATAATQARINEQAAKLQQFERQFMPSTSQGTPSHFKAPTTPTARPLSQQILSMPQSPLSPRGPPLPPKSTKRPMSMVGPAYVQR